LMHLSSKDKTLFVELSKGAKDRIVPVLDETWELIRNYYHAYHKKAKPSKHDFLFEGMNDGEQYSVRSIQEILNKAVRKAGILKHVTIHTLRHSRATHMVRGGMDLVTLKEMLGHWQLKTTEIYTHTDTDDMRNMMLDADRKLAFGLPMPEVKYLKAV
ncbi:MAG: tyrosine-type recombinase/integrase, partial [Sediminibacterium sp.]